MIDDTLQDLVDELAQQLGLPVAINNLALDLIAASSQVGQVDDYRISSIIQRHTPAAVRTLLHRRGVLTQTKPFLLEADALPGVLARVCIPVVASGAPIAFIWIVVDGATLSTAQYEFVRDAADHVARLLSGAHPELPNLFATDTQQLVAVLDADEYRAGYAAAALSRDGLLAADDAAMIAVFDVSDESSQNEDASARGTTKESALRLAHSIGRETWANAGVLGMANGNLVLLGSLARLERRVETAIGEIQRAFEGTPFNLNGVGTSTTRNWSRGFHSAHEEAAYAARVAPVLYPDRRRADFDQLGAFALFRGLPLTEQMVELISPAAAALRASRNDVSLDTVTTFLEAAGSVAVACTRLAVHRTTLYYRLGKAQEYIGEALESGTSRTSLHVGLMLGHLIDRIDATVAVPQQDRERRAG
jgi:PucR C-terminal helix-turn-helix domain